MPPSGYVELHCHSGFSFLDGASSPEELALEAAHLGYPALALTDHHGLYGSMAFAQAATRLGLQAITGAEVTLDSGAHLTLLAETATGYANLCRLITTAHLGSPDRRDPRLPFSSLIERHEGLIVLSGCRDGLLPKTLDREGTAAGRRLAELCRDTFGSERFFVELQRNGVRGDRGRTRALADLAETVGLPVVATRDVHYHNVSRYRLHDVLVAIKNRTSLDGAHVARRPNNDFYLRPPEDVAALFPDLPRAIDNTRVIAERCAGFDLTRDLGYTFPDFHGADKTPAPQALALFCRARLEERYPPGSTWRARTMNRCGAGPT